MLRICSDILSDIVNINCLFNGSISCQYILQYMLLLSTLTLYLVSFTYTHQLTHLTPINAMFSYLINQHLPGQYLQYLGLLGCFGVPPYLNSIKTKFII